MTRTECVCGQRDCRCREPREANVPMSDPYAVRPSEEPAAAGRELDANVARKVMGIECFTHIHEDGRVDWIEEHGDGPVARYSTDIAAAWQVVEKMRERGWFLNLHEEGALSQQWVCVFDDDAFDSGEFLAPTAPLAICRAALGLATANAAPTDASA